MAHLIDKDAVLAIIEKELSYYKDLEDRGIISEAGIAAYRVIRLLKSDINSLEVKEVELEKEISFQWSKFCIYVEKDYHINLTREMEWLRNKTQKGEDV